LSILSSTTHLITRGVNVARNCDQHFFSFWVAASTFFRQLRCAVFSIVQQCALRSTQRDETTVCIAREAVCAQNCTVRSIVQQFALHVKPRAQENALHVPCDYTARCISKCISQCIVNIVQRFVLAAVSPSQVKPSAAASGGTAQRRAQRQAGVLRSVQQSTKRFRRCVRNGKSIAQRPAQRPALHCTEHSEPRQGRSQQANQASCAKGVCCIFFVRSALYNSAHCAVPSATSRARKRPTCAMRP